MKIMHIPNCPFPDGMGMKPAAPGDCRKELQLHVPFEDGHKFRGSIHWKLESVRGRSVRQGSLGRSSILKGSKIRLKRTTVMSGGGAS